MIHSDLLNSLTDNEKVMLLACMRHATNGDYNYNDIQYIRKPFFRKVLEQYYNIVSQKHKPLYISAEPKVLLNLKSPVAGEPDL